MGQRNSRKEGENKDGHAEFTHGVTKSARQSFYPKSPAANMQQTKDLLNCFPRSTGQEEMYLGNLQDPQ